MDRIHAIAGPLRALATAGALLAAPAAATAGDEFEDGFKDELGRVAAHEAFGIGRGVLAQVLLVGGPGYYVEQYPVYGRGYYSGEYDRGGWDYPRYPYGGYPHHYRSQWGHPGHGWGHHRHHRPRHHHHGHHYRSHHGCR